MPLSRVACGFVRVGCLPFVSCASPRPRSLLHHDDDDDDDSDQDRADLDFALVVPGGVDVVALSFVQTAADVQELKDVVQGRCRVSVQNSLVFAALSRLRSGFSSLSLPLLAGAGATTADACHILLPSIYLIVVPPLFLFLVLPYR